MSKWQGFLDSLATKGGNILLLIVMSLIFGIGGVAMMLKFGPTAPAVGLIVGSFSNFSGALLMAFVGKERNGNGNGPSSPTTPTT